MHFIREKPPHDVEVFLAGAEGFEPSTKVLETHVLPLHHAPIAFATALLYEKCEGLSSTYLRQNEDGTIVRTETYSYAEFA